MNGADPTNPAGAEPPPHAVSRVPAAAARKRWGAAAVLFLAAIGLGIALIRPQESIQNLLDRGQEAFVAGDIRQAQQFAERILDRNPEHVQALHLAGRCADVAGDYGRALEFFQRIPDDGSIGAVQARCMAGNLLLERVPALSEAESQFRRALELDPGNGFANDRLAYLLGLAGRSWDAVPFRLQTVREQRADRAQLFVLALGDLARENPEAIPAFHAAQPEDPLPKLGLALQALDRHDEPEARRLLTDALNAQPDLVEAHARIGRLMFDAGEFDRLPEWHQQLPSAADAHPGIWKVRGLWARAQGQESAAARCLWEAVRLDPNSQDANYQLGQSLLALGRMNDAERFHQRSRDLQDYLFHAHMVHGAAPGSDAAELKNAAEAAHGLGLLWESLGWTWLALADNPALVWAQQLLQQVAPEVSDSTLARCHPRYNPALQVDLSSLPLPDFRSSAPSDSIPQVTQSTRNPIQLRDRAREAGIDFQYFNGGDPHEVHVVPLYEQTGGGAGALDYDADGWPDLYLAQGGAWPPIDGPPTYLDRLYRNRGDGAFLDVTHFAAVTEDRFSQGVAAGDINNDGFEDLLVANIGVNRLFVNNGDGTFTEMPVPAFAEQDDWTVSCLIADLNGDALPDLYAVNYLGGSDVFTRICRNPDGTPRPCAIQSYPAAQDRLLLNRGDGSFDDVTEQCGIVQPGGRGMGIVAADFTGAGVPSLYVANDVSPNFYLVNESQRGAALPRFREQGVVAAVAVNELGQYEASMGIAAGDSDGDGLLDLFVSNFEGESNTLYRFQEAGYFHVATREAGLHDAQSDWLGFGCQFLDLDLDGDLDLVLANGHVDDVRAAGRAYEMPPQCFRNLGNGRFEELPASELGDYFSGRYLGRALVRLDWNRDGREDFVVTHLDQPVALVTNTAPTENHSVSIRVIGTSVDRDAITTTATLVTSSSTRVRQLAAGDGYQASNEQRLHFGVPHDERIERLQVRWPSGAIQTFDQVPLDQELLLVEGRPVLLPLPRSSDAPQ